VVGRPAGETITATGGHLFLTAGGEWVPAKDLRAGDRLVDPDGTPVTIATVERRSTVATVHNLTVDTDHTYTVVTTEGTDVITHNDSVEDALRAAGGAACELNGRNGRGPADELLSSIAEEGRTAGVLDIDGELIPLVSGRSPLRNYAASGHVEGQAALIMRDRGATNARLLIDNPNGVCGYCNSQVPTLLPDGAVLTVVTPLGTVTPSARWFNGKTFVGNSKSPKAWPR